MLSLKVRLNSRCHDLPINRVVVEILEAARKSAKTQKTVKLAK
ncbi:hypothetical protein [Hymenobacter sp.]